MRKQRRLYAALSIMIASLSVVFLLFAQSFMIGPITHPHEVHHIQHEKKIVHKISVSSRLFIAKMIMYNSSKGLQKQGFVAIPSVKILLPIYNDAYSENGLSYGASYANRSEQDPTGKLIPHFGSGNYGLAAHNFNDGKTGFSALQQRINDNHPYLSNDNQFGHSSWLNGQFVYLANGDAIYQYKIIDQYGTKSSDIGVLNQTRKSKLTIISCLFPNIANRIITVAVLSNKYSWQDAPDNVVALFNLQTQNTNARANWFNPGVEEGANGSMGGTKH